MELLLGCGHNRDKKLKPAWTVDPDNWTKLVTYDIDPTSGADVIGDFEEAGLPFPDDTFDEVHAYDVMEHFGSQGDYRAFFRDFGEIYRVLKPNGLFCGITPHWRGPWLWNDPGHRRSISLHTLQWLNQLTYAEVGSTSITDYRWLWKGDLRLVWSGVTFEDVADVENPGVKTPSSNVWVLQAIKPAGQPVKPATV